jgi:hypothetical protein
MPSSTTAGLKQPNAIDLLHRPPPSAPAKTPSTPPAASNERPHRLDLTPDEPTGETTSPSPRASNPPGRAMRSIRSRCPDLPRVLISEDSCHAARVVCALVAGRGNLASQALHKRLGFTEMPKPGFRPEGTPRTHDPSSSTVLNYTGSSERLGSKGQRRAHGRALLTLSARTLLPRRGRSVTGHMPPR